jgi:hypothetical protein
MRSRPGSRAKQFFAIEFFTGRNLIYTRYHHRGKRGHTDESVTERTSAFVQSPLGGGRDFALAGHLV